MNNKLECEKSKLERIKEYYKKGSMGDILFKFLIKIQDRDERRCRKNESV